MKSTICFRSIVLNSLLLLAFIASPTAGQAQDADINTLSQVEKDAGFVSMFNGKDFSGWRFETLESPPKKLPSNWSVADGVIKLSGGGSPHLGSAQAYADFEMKFEWRALKDKYNSGFFIRSGEKVGANQLNLAKGSEGAFINGKVTGAMPVPKLQKPAGEWNEWRVLVVGDKVTFWCNGELAWEATGLQSKSGCKPKVPRWNFASFEFARSPSKNSDCWHAHFGWRLQSTPFASSGTPHPCFDSGSAGTLTACCMRARFYTVSAKAGTTPARGLSI